ncbi:hypothetical protein H4219_002467 [Mycoemilia scoparia]|uniref:Uncharacterized protein n=1 Tax=Mycoemilia scoparia TaxID=417184 RepID=A0A9W7ZXH4_9FUNG|nr:hypothetical protein H4219_002467 [Mycoemilia scoparia]
MLLPDVKDGILQPSGNLGKYVYLAIYTKQFQWVETLHAFNIASIILSSITILIVVCCIRHRDFVDRPSFRLSASIAFGDICYSLGHILLYNTSVDEPNMEESKLRAMFWLWFFGLGLMVFSTTCITLHLHLTAVLNKPLLAIRLSSWYEVFAWTVSFAVSQPLFYIYVKLLQVPTFRTVVLIETSKKSIRAKAWFIYIWMAIALVYCLIVCILVVERLFPIWRRSTAELRRPEGHDNSSHGSNTGREMMGRSVASQTGHTVYERRQQAAAAAAALASGREKFQNYNSSSRQNNGVKPPLLSSMAISRGAGNISHMLNNASNHNIRENSLSNNDRRYLPNSLSESFSFGGRDMPPPRDPNSSLGAGGGGPPLTSALLLTTNPRIKSQAYLHKRKREIELMVLRIFIYPLIPLITTIWQPVYHTLVDSSITLGYVCLLMPSMQAIFNFLVFLINPTMDEFWRKAWLGLRRRYNDYRNTPGTFTRLGSIFGCPDPAGRENIRSWPLSPLAIESNTDTTKLPTPYKVYSTSSENSLTNNDAKVGASNVAAPTTRGRRTIGESYNNLHTQNGSGGLYNLDISYSDEYLASKGLPRRTMI